jgi:hypothetical protein
MKKVIVWKVDKIEDMHMYLLTETIKKALRIRDVYPRSRIRLFSIPDPKFFHPGSASKEFQYFNPKKWFLSSKKYDPGCSSPIPDTGSRGQKGTGSRIPRIRIRNTGEK